MRYVACLVCTLWPSLAIAQGGFPEDSRPSLNPAPQSTGSPAVPPSPPSLTGLTFAAGVGYGSPFGDVFKQLPGSYADTSMTHSISNQVPLAFSAGYRLFPLLSFGVAFQYAILSTKNCPTGETCTAHDTRVGGEIRLHVVPDLVFSPWILLGGGYAWLSSTESTRNIAVHMTLSGWEAEVGAGGDIRVTPFLTLGPYVGVRWGKYGYRALSGNGAIMGSGDIHDGDQKTHGWVAFGVRGAFTLFPR